MMSIQCPHCSRVGSLKVAVPVGTMVRCPGCRQKFAISHEAPANGNEIIDLDDEPSDEGSAGFGVNSATATSVATAYPVASIVVPPVSTLFSSVAPEPWFYGWIDRLARGIWQGCRIIMVGFAVIAVLLVFVAFYASINHWSNVIGPVFGTVLLGYLGLWLTLLPTFLLAALLMLAVDLARNIRATRYR